MAWLDIWFSVSNTCGGVWSNRESRETDEEHDEDRVKEGFQLTRVKSGRDDEGDRETLGMRNCSINILNGSEL